MTSMAPSTDGSSPSNRSSPNMATEDDIRQVLRGVVDPELHADIVDLGMVQRIGVDESGTVEIIIALTISGCPLRAQIRDDVRARVGAMNGVRQVEIHFGELNAQQRTQVMQRARLRARDRAPETEIASSTKIIAIASGKGGVGKSSVTVNLAVALAARGLTVGVLDADIWGFSIPRMLGLEGRLGGTGGLIKPAERIIEGPTPDLSTSDPSTPDPSTPDPSTPGLSTPDLSTSGPPKVGLLKVVSMGLVVDDEDKAIMWRGLLLAKAVEEFLTKVAWGQMDYLLIDMPPGTGDVQMALSRLLPRAELLIVTTPALAAQKVAVRVADMAKRGYLHVLGVIENMSWFDDSAGVRTTLFGSGGGQRLADDTGVPLVAQIPIAPSISAGGDVGEPAALELSGPVRDAFAALAERVHTELSPPLAMEGCTARMLAAIETALDAAPNPG